MENARIGSIHNIVLPYYAARGIGYLGLKPSSNKEFLLGFDEAEISIENLADSIGFENHSVFDLNKYNSRYNSNNSFNLSLLINSVQSNVPTPSKHKPHIIENIYWANEGEVLGLFNSKIIHDSESLMVLAAYLMNKPLFAAHNFFN